MMNNGQYAVTAHIAVTLKARRSVLTMLTALRCDVDPLSCM